MNSENENKVEMIPAEASVVAEREAAEKTEIEAEGAAPAAEAEAPAEAPAEA